MIIHLANDPSTGCKHVEYIIQKHSMSIRYAMS
jgi:hypothetical protein